MILYLVSVMTSHSKNQWLRKHVQYKMQTTFRFNTNHLLKNYKTILLLSSYTHIKQKQARKANKNKRR